MAKVESKVTIMHLDVDNLTSKGKTASPYRNFIINVQTYTQKCPSFSYPRRHFHFSWAVIISWLLQIQTIRRAQKNLLI